MAKTTDEPKSAAHLKIGEVARLTGVSVPTIHYYIREGVLPRPPRKTSPNMAYYDQAFVARIQLIRRLQKERRLPLAVIRSLLNEGVAESDEALLALVELRAKGLLPRDNTRAEPGLGRAEFLERTAIDPADLDELEKMAVISPKGPARKRRYGANDLTIALTVAKIRTLGLDRDAFPTSDLALYQRAIGELVGEEAQLFARRIRGQETRFSSRELLEAAIELMGELIVHLRRKLIVDLTRSLELDDTSEPAAASRSRKRAPRKR